MVKIQNKTKILIIILCVLLILNFVLIMFNNKGKQTVFQSPLVLKSEIQNIDKIIISVPDDSEPPIIQTLSFEKSGDGFLFNTSHGQYTVKDEIVKGLFLALTEETKLTEISDDAKSLKYYNLEDSSASRIQLQTKTGSFLADLMFGTTDTLGSNIFLRTGSIKIYKTQNRYSEFLTLKSSYWLDLKIYAGLLLKNDIQGVNIDGNIITRTPELNTAFLELEQKIKSFTCIGIYYATGNETVDTKSFRLLLGNNESINISYTKLQNGDYVFTDNRNANMYIASEYSVNRLEKALKKIIKDLPHQ